LSGVDGVDSFGVVGVDGTGVGIPGHPDSPEHFPSTQSLFPLHIYLASQVLFSLS